MQSNVVCHGRRAGQIRSAGERPEFKFQGNGSNGLDIRSVKIISRDEYNRLYNTLNRKQIEEEERKRIQAINEDIRARSHEMVKNWTNTVMGARQRKLEEREIRLAKEEEEKKKIDIEEARLASEWRKEQIEKAKTQQYYQTDRVKNFHSALTLTEVLKEREAQMELKRLKAQADGGEDARYLEIAQKEYEESVKKDQEAASKRILAARETAEYQKAQIRRHQAEYNKEKDEELQEGENIHRLAVANALERQRLDQLHREEQQRNMKENLRQISDVKRMREIERIQDEEADEDCRIFAAAKKKMVRLRLEKEKEIHTKKMENLERIKKKLSDELAAIKNDEEDRLNRAVEEREAQAEAEDAEKEEKRRKMLMEIAEHRAEQKRKAEEEAQNKRLRDLEMIHARKAADELYRKNEAEKRHKEFMRAKGIAEYTLAQVEEQREKVRLAREDDLKFDADTEKLVDQEERQFQEYASKVIDHCKRGGRPTYALEKAAEAGAGGGLGPQFPGKGGVRPSYLTADQKGIQLPHFKPPSQDIKESIYGKENSTAHRLGFVW